MSSSVESSKQELLVDIFSDVVCPWCFIGKRQLEVAIRELSHEQPAVKVTVRWLPYFLNPDAPEEGDPYRPFLDKKFGGAAAVDALLARVQAAALGIGLELALDKITLRGNTLNAHRLIHRFQQRGNADAVVEKLFAAHFQRGEFIGDKALLVKIAVECGDEAGAVAAYLDSNEDSIVVLEQARRAQKAGISGVPFFIFNGKHALSGAQPAQEILGVIHQSLDDGTDTE